MNEKFCVCCRHFSTEKDWESGIHPVCLHPKATLPEKLDIVTGKVIDSKRHIMCKVFRAEFSPSGCGEEGFYYEDKRL